MPPAANGTTTSLFSSLGKYLSPRSLAQFLGRTFLAAFIAKLLQTALSTFFPLTESDIILKEGGLWVAFRTQLLAHLWVAVAVAAVWFVGEIFLHFRRLSRTVEAFSTRLTSLLRESAPRLDELIREVESVMARPMDTSERDALENNVDPKLSASLNYSISILRKSPPPVNPDPPYIDDMFLCASSVYALWTDVPSTWLDPMMQFYLTNLGMKNLTEHRLSSGVNRIGVFPRTSSEYDAFLKHVEDLLKEAAQGAGTPQGQFRMARILLLEDGWETHYRSELVLLTAVCELFRIPCFMIRMGPLRQYLAGYSSVAGELKAMETSIKEQIRSVLGEGAMSQKEGLIRLTEGGVGLHGMLILDRNKYYIFTRDATDPFRCITDSSQTSARLFESLLRIYARFPDCRFAIPGDKLNRNHTILQ